MIAAGLMTVPQRNVGRVRMPPPSRRRGLGLEEESSSSWLCCAVVCCVLVSTAYAMMVGRIDGWKRHGGDESSVVRKLLLTTLFIQKVQYIDT